MKRSNRTMAPGGRAKPRRRGLLLGLAALAALALLLVLIVRAGVYNVAADDPHTPLTFAVLEQVRTASVRARAAKLKVPADLDSPARITQGAGNYDAMCTGCHLAPGMGPTELSRGLYPAPPDLTRTPVVPAEAFWVIKHGIKASGMPAWGRSMGDEYIWNMVAFLQQLPKLDEAGYRDLVARSGGHSHGGGETGGHGHGEMDEADAHPHPQAGTAGEGAPQPSRRRHPRRIRTRPARRRTTTRRKRRHPRRIRTGPARRRMTTRRAGRMSIHPAARRTSTTRPRRPIRTMTTDHEGTRT
ncbi:MAG: c-type cytochrome [Pseudomonadota bacterium]